MKYPSVRIAEVAGFNPVAPKRLVGSDTEVAFVPMTSVSELGMMTVGEHRLGRQLNTGFSYFQNGDTLVAKITPCYENNKTCSVNIDREHGFGSTEFHVLRPDPSRLDTSYLTAFLRQDRVREAGARRMTGSGGQRRVPRAFFEGLEIPLPPLEEQRRIAAILDQADELRRKRRQTLSCLDVLIDAVFERIILREALKHKKLSECVNGMQIGPFGSLLHASDYVDDGIPLVNPRNIVDGKIVVNSSNSISRAKYATLSRYHLKIGDVIMGRRGEMGRCAIITNRENGYLCGTGSLFMTPDNRFVTSEFLKRYLSSPRTVRLLEMAAQGVTMANLNLKALQELDITIPSIVQQKKFDKFEQIISRDIGISQASLAQMDALFASLQYRAFSGEL